MASHCLPSTTKYVTWYLRPHTGNPNWSFNWKFCIRNIPCSWQHDWLVFLSEDKCPGLFTHFHRSVVDITSYKKSALTWVPVGCELWPLEFAQKPREEATGIFFSLELILTQQEDQKVFANWLLQLGWKILRILLDYKSKWWVCQEETWLPWDGRTSVQSIGHI